MASSLFQGQRVLNTKYIEIPFGTLTGKSSPALAVNVHTFDQACKIALFDNATNGVLRVLLVHPDADTEVVTNRLLWFEVDAERTLDASFFSMVSFGTDIPAGTRMFIHYNTTAPTQDKLRILLY